MLKTLTAACFLAVATVGGAQAQYYGNGGYYYPQAYAAPAYGAPVYAAPAYSAPQVVYAQPQVVYQQPQVVYTQPAYYAPAYYPGYYSPFSIGLNFGFGGGRHWR